MRTNRVFNEKLKFSWGHIIAAIALVAIAYCTYVGSVYLLNGTFVKGAFLWISAGIVTLLVVVLLGVIFFVPQQLKGTEHHFERRIKWERVFIFSSPVLFVALMIPFAHAWTVHHRRAAIHEEFKQMIESTSKMFSKYSGTADSYCDVRESNFEQKLATDPSLAHLAESTRENKKEILRLALRSENYTTIKNDAENWMKKAGERSTSTWNVFLLGNIEDIQNAIHGWCDTLQNYSTFYWEEEDEKARTPFDKDGAYMKAIDKNVNQLIRQYRDIKGFSPLTILWLVLGYAMLILPYLLQSRHSKTIGTQWTLFRTKKLKSPDYHEPDDDEEKDNHDKPHSSHDNPSPHSTTGSGGKYEDYAPVKI